MQINKIGFALVDGLEENPALADEKPASRCSFAPLDSTRKYITLPLGVNGVVDMGKSILFAVVVSVLASCAQTRGDHSNATATVNMNTNVARNMGTVPTSSGAAAASTSASAAQ